MQKQYRLIRQIRQTSDFHSEDNYAVIVECNTSFYMRVKWQISVVGLVHNILLKLGVWEVKGFTSRLWDLMDVTPTRRI